MRTSIIPSATTSLPRVFSVAWAFLTSAVTFIIHNRILRWAGHVARMPMSREPGATAVTDWLGIAFSTDWLSTDDLGQDVGQK